MRCLATCKMLIKLFSLDSSAAKRVSLLGIRQEFEGSVGSLGSSPELACRLKNLQ